MNLFYFINKFISNWSNASTYAINRFPINQVLLKVIYIIYDRSIEILIKSVELTNLRAFEPTSIRTYEHSNLRAFELLSLTQFIPYLCRLLVVFFFECFVQHLSQFCFGIRTITAKSWFVFYFHRTIF